MLAGLLAAGLFAAAPAAAQVSESVVKAAFLPRFARYVTWPAEAAPKGDAPVYLCVIGSDPFGAALDDAAGSQSIDGHRVVVRRLPSVAGAGNCQIAFIHGAAGQPVGASLAALGRRPILTVTDARGGSQRGIIHFVVRDGRVRFYIDEAQASAHGLAVSSRLLTLAVGVKQR